MVAENPLAAYNYRSRGAYWMQQGDFAAAAADFSSAIVYDPTSPALHLRRGNAYFKIKQFELAIADFSRESSSIPTNRSASTAAAPPSPIKASSSSP